ncbi:MAG: YkgJ family cysteine cluster protein [Planctomycetes bacterium]|nr:YkgJ family cysteine cluster protein [Planctomycetota bacterium]
MKPIATTDSLPLTCTREGACCFGAVIRITPWELAVLARHVGEEAAAFRDRHTCDGGTAMRLDGEHDRLGHRACTLYRGGSGCSAHPARPLACRLFPLGRQRVDGIARYHHPGRTVGCAELCPASQALPVLRVGDYLAQQQVSAGEAAHDAYAAFLAGLVATAGGLCRHAGTVGLEEALLQRAAAAPEARMRAVPTAWFELLTAPSLPVPLDEPHLWVGAHRARVAQAVATGWQLDGDMTDTALVIATLALHLGPTVGTSPELVAQAIATTARAAA